MQKKKLVFEIVNRRVKIERGEPWKASYTFLVVGLHHE